MKKQYVLFIFFVLMCFVLQGTSYARGDGAWNAEGNFTTIKTGDTTIGTNSAGANLETKSTLGSELITSPMVSGGWTLETDWSITDGVLSKVVGGDIYTATVATGMTSAPEVGKYYQVTVVVSECSLTYGYFRVDMGGVQGDRHAVTGTFTDSYLALNTNKLSITAREDVAMSITSISVKEITTSTGDVTVEGKLTVNGGVNLSAIPAIADADGEANTGLQFCVSDGTGVMVVGERSATGINMNLVQGVDTDTEFNTTQYVKGLYIAADLTSDKVTWGNLVAVDVRSLDYSGDHSTTNGFFSGLKAGGTGSKAYSYDSQVDLEDEVTPIAQEGTNFSGWVGRLGVGDTVYGLYISQVYGPWIKAGNIYGYYFDVADTDPTLKYAIYAKNGLNYFGSDVQLGDEKITAGTATGLVVNSIGHVNRQLYQATVTYDDFTDTDTTKGIVICTLPAKTKIVGIYADVTTKFVGGAINACTLEIGATSEGAADILAAGDVFTAAIVLGDADAELGTAMVRAAAIQGGYLPSWSGTTAIYATIDSTNGNTNALTQGAVTFYIETERY